MRDSDRVGKPEMTSRGEKMVPSFQQIILECEASKLRVRTIGISSGKLR